MNTNETLHPALWWEPSNDLNVQCWPLPAGLSYCE